MSYTHTALITGGTANLGFHCALSIARQHPEYLVVICSRSDPNDAAKSINEATLQTNVIFLPIDLSSLANVRAFADSWKTNQFPPIIALVLNAGLQFPGGVQLTSDGMESTFEINHVGHALLFHLLFPHLANKARITVTSSGTHDPAQKTGLPDAEYITAEQLAHPTPESAKYAGRQRYSSSKLANVLWTYALHRRLSAMTEKNMTAVAFDPGLMPGTGLAREAAYLVRFLWLRVMPHMLPLLRFIINHNIHTPQESGANLARLAVGADVEGKSGIYFEGKEIIKSSKDSYDERKQDDLWEWTIKATARSAEERREFELVK
ncbi:hypothetical protein V495_08849 [Pseudogymnoascus sp. VKM F-4514 (FW-929)]|nr:hypothetical protein V495_08849 [Pseudogymnoascus sp. VKM F-4514 (FW-929)]KFY60776.1 hypothetical protein V497_03374 [Pseudogymnoascus sp. VKM F-4516 (FW-969)]